LSLILAHYQCVVKPTWNHHYTTTTPPQLSRIYPDIFTGWAWQNLGKEKPHARIWHGAKCL